MTRSIPFLAALTLFLSACEPSDPAVRAASDRDRAATRTGIAGDAAEGVVTIRALSEGDRHWFELSSDEIPSGWTTFRLENASHVAHFALIDKLPEGTTFDQYSELTGAYQALMDAIIAGEPTEPVVERFPAWSSGVEFLGGPGLLSPGRVSETTVRLEPGPYVVECYVKTPEGQFHAYLGMKTPFRVTAAQSPAEPPVPTMEITVSSESGIDVQETVRPGQHTVAVYFADQTAHENFVGHDVNLVRLSDDADVDALAAWMNWTAPSGLSSPGEPAEFRGGANDMPAGHTAYFTAELEPGRYAWISEVPNAQSKGMLKPFNVAQQ